jgi:hypothetical protein
VDEIVGVNQCGFRHNRSFAFVRYWKRREYNDTVHWLFVDFKKAHDSVRREVLYNILMKFGEPMKQVRLIKMCLNESYSKVRIGKYLSDNFFIQNGCFIATFFNFALVYAFRKVQENHVGLKLNEIHQLMVYADDVNLLVYNIHNIKKNRGTLINASKEVVLEVNTRKLKISL